ncbi:LAGLIDADG family homing endonuclease [Bifidobacterium callitrichidarum]|uniref:DOD-type homing endonuclease domain-containing protein n=1 Tax=Bifidobacterium callitrichidarum TaxID=2052941 RepID=A0A2U2N123_9BIFI|nr:LAGLIDADG family homing endonuclease [Bifidobacterium callitrichidarum]PWG62664.1 hypothetical protein DF196_11945 [Bifidobacterium callitrichidarum]
MANTNESTQQTESFISPDTRYGLLRAVTPDRTVWLYAKIPPSAALTDGANNNKRSQVCAQLMAFFDGLAGQVTVSGMKYRYMLKSQYRAFHLLSGAIPVPYQTAPKMRGTDLGNWQNQAYQSQRVQRQFAVIGVPLHTGSLTAGKTRHPRLLERAFTSIDRLAYSIANGQPTFEEYLDDAHTIETIMLNAGLEPFTRMDNNKFNETLSMMKSWWVADNSMSALGVLPENDHIHLFGSVDTAKQAKKFYDDGKPCDDWNLDNEYPATICFARSSDFQGNKVADASNQWIARMLEVAEAGGANTVGVSIRGVVEPAAVTADQIRRNRKTIDETVRDRHRHGREATGDMEEIMDKLEYKRNIYKNENMPPTLIDLSVAACVAGKKKIALDALAAVPGVEFVNMNTANEQLNGFKSMQPCSPIRMTPYELQWSAPCVAGGGVSSMAVAGDKTGALLGFSEANRQPVYIGTTTVQDEDKKPFMVIAGSTGSGKANAISSHLPVPPQSKYPHGQVIRFGDLEKGDFVYGRDGKPAEVKELHPIINKDIYEVTLSDGQKIKASGDHLWTVSSFTDRNKNRSQHHLTAISRYNELTEISEKLQDLSQTYPVDQTMTSKELGEVVKPIIGKWLGKADPERWVRASLHLMDFSGQTEVRDEFKQSSGTAYTHKQNCMRYDPKTALTYLVEHFDYVATHDKRWRKQAQIKADRLRAHLNDEFDRGISDSDIIAMLGDMAPKNHGAFSTMLKKAGFEPISYWDENTRVMPDRSGQRSLITFNVRGALIAISIRLLQRYWDDEPNTDYEEQVVSTREMLAQGITRPASFGGQAEWAIHVPKPVQNRHLALPVDPYLLGAWLADGTIKTGTIASNPYNGDLEYLMKRFEAKGYPCHRLTNIYAFSAQGFITDLKKIGVYDHKFIPEQYFFADIEQRLELVRGLIDQDGSIDNKLGSIEFCQSLDHKEIIRGVIRLLRSLGIVVHEYSQSEAGYTVGDERISTQDRLRITFTTDIPVFALKRKRDKLPTELRETQQWLYIKDIKPIADEPARCITVDSPDHTYLIEDYVPTHNTMTLLSLAFQWMKIDSRSGKGKTPVIFIDPKEDSDFSEPVIARGGTVYSMDSDIANGTFDPLNVLQNPEEAKEMAAIMLSNIFSPGGKDADMEISVTAMLDFGIKAGAKCCGVAIETAYQAFKRGGAEAKVLPPNTEQVRDQVMRLLRSNQFLRIIVGTTQDVKPLKVSQALTLIKAGKRSIVPAEGSEGTVTGRIQRWVLRMTVLGAGAAVRGRDGMVILDEAWVALGADSGTVVQQWGRLARSQRFTPVLASQKVDEFIDAGLTGAISRGLLLSLDDSEADGGSASVAKAALKLFSVDDSDGHIRSRMPLPPVKDNGAPNWSSLQRLKNPNNPKETIRGAVGYFEDNGQLPVPVEIWIPPKLLQEISTTATDVIAREERKKRLMQQQQQEQNR